MMFNAFVLLNCDIGAEGAIINQMNTISGVSEAVRVSGVYDIVAKLSDESQRENIITGKENSCDCQYQVESNDDCGK